MLKSDVLGLFQGSIALAAHKIGVTVRTIEMWPEELDRARVDRVIAALVRDQRADKAIALAKRYTA